MTSGGPAERAAAFVLDTPSSHGPVARPTAAAVLGTGFDSLARHGLATIKIAYDRIPGFPRCGVPGHTGELTLFGLEQERTAVFSGRLHAYEGHSPEEVVFPVDLAAALGARVLFLTCAAGGIRDDLQAGDLVSVSDHLNLMGWTPPTCPAGFVDLSEAYDPTLRTILEDEAARDGFALKTGVLAGVAGPAYETPAEVRMLSTLGADLVSMSTVPEVIRARALGLRVAAVACVSNRAASLGGALLAHDDVVARVREVLQRRRGFFTGVLGRLARIAASASARVRIDPST